MRQLPPAVCVLTFTLFASGCIGPRTSFVTNRGEAPTLSPSRVLLATHLLDPRHGPNYGGGFAKGFEDGLEAGLRACGASLKTQPMTSSETDRLATEGAYDEWRPEAVLLIHRDGGALAGFGQVVRTDFDLVLFDAGEATAGLGAFLRAGGKLRPVWRANLKVSPGDHSFLIKTFTDDGEAVGQRVVEQLRRDGFFPDCGVAKRNASTKPLAGTP